MTNVSDSTTETRPVAVIVNYNQPELTANTVYDLCKHDEAVRNGDIVVLVAENGCSQAHTESLLQFIDGFPVSVVPFQQRLNYAQVCNWLSREFPQSPHYFYLNNDLVIQGPVLSDLSDVLHRESSVGIVVPLMNCHGPAQNINTIRRKLGPEVPAWTQTGYRPGRVGEVPDRMEVERVNNRVKALVECGTLPRFVYSSTVAAFSCVGVHRSVLESVGGQDESFPYGLGADDDLCMRALRFGWKIATCMSTFVGHIGKVSLAQEGEEYHTAQQQAIAMMKSRWVLPGKKTISVVVPSYNCGRYLWNCLLSLQRQTHTDREIIVVDDGSQDETQEVLKYFNVVKLRNHTNMGANVARNKGAAVARGRYIVFCDADAVYDRVFLEELITALRGTTTPDVGYAYCDFKLSGDRGDSGTHYSGVWQERKLIEQNFVAFPSLIRRNLFPGVDMKLRRHQDWDVWLTMLEAGYKGVYVPKTLFMAYKRAEGISGQGGADRILSKAIVQEKHGI